VSYHQLSNDSGGDSNSRRAEADRIIKILKDAGVEDYSQKEIDFIEQMDEGGPVSVKRIFWLRDIKAKGE
jgi:hypothetical protein